MGRTKTQIERRVITHKKPQHFTRTQTMVPVMCDEGTKVSEMFPKDN